MGHPLLVLLLALLAPAGALAEPAGPDRVQVPGTRVTLPVPEGFAPSDAFPGIGREADLTSVLVTELAAPFETSLRDFAPDALARRGVSLHRATDVRVDGHRGRLLHATQRVGGTTFRKWILILGDDTASVLVTATTPLDLESTHQEALVGVLQGAGWDPARAVASEQTRFRVPEVPPLRVVRTAPNAIVLSDPDHEAGPEGAIPPLVLAGSSRARVQVVDLARFAEERLRETVLIDEIEVTASTAATLADRPARRIEATARDVESGRPVRVFQLLAVDEERYTLLQGIVDAERAEGFESLFAAVADGLALAPTPSP